MSRSAKCDGFNETLGILLVEFLAWGSLLGFFRLGKSLGPYRNVARSEIMEAVKYTSNCPPESSRWNVGWAL